MNSIKEKFDEFISQYPIFEYRVLDTGCLLYTSPSPRDA